MAIVVPDAEVIEAWAQSNRIEGDVNQLCQNEVIYYITPVNQYFDIYNCLMVDSHPFYKCRPDDVINFVYFSFFEQPF